MPPCRDDHEKVELADGGPLRVRCRAPESVEPDGPERGESLFPSGEGGYRISRLSRKEVVADVPTTPTRALAKSLTP